MITSTKFSIEILIFVAMSLLITPASSRRQSGELVDMAESPARQSPHIAENPTRQLTQENLDGRNLLVRIFNDWHNDPHAYKLISVPLSGPSVSFDAVRKTFPGIKDTAVVVISGRQQKDEVVAKMLGDSVCAERFKEGKQLFFRPLLPGQDGSSELNVTDALGLAFPKASVDIFVRGPGENGPRIYLSTPHTDEQGRLEVPDLTGELRLLSFVISQPNYGIALIDPYIDIGERKELTVPLVARSSEAFQRSIHGVVADSQGNPVAGAVVECSYIRTLGEGLINALNDWSNKSLTDDNGAFSLYLPNEDKRGERGYLIPPKSQYNVRIEAPKELGLSPYVKPIENGQDALVFLESSGHFRTLVFEDANGPITDPKKLQYIVVTIIQSDGSRVSLRYEDFKDGGVFPLGEYHAVRRGMDEFDFEPLTINEQSPDELVFRQPEDILYYGRIVHGLTGEPMPGAFVIGFISSSHGNLSMITDQQWQALHALPAEPGLTDPAVKPICQIYGVKKIVRTDELGNFQMSFRPGEIYGFIAFEQDYLGLMHRRHALIFDEYRQAEIPVMKLYPAATVLIEPRTEAKRISIWPRWIIDENENPVWVRQFLATDDRKESMFTYDGWIEQNKVQSFHVPAGLILHVKLDTPYDRQFCPIEIPKVINLAQGQVLDLGRHQFKPALEVYVQITNSQGQAVEGVPVRILSDGNTWSVSHNTDESGLALFNVVPYSAGRFGVSCRPEGGEYLTENIPYQVGGNTDSGRLFTLQLSDKILELLFKSNDLEPLKP
jgi:hypothetical protein